MCRWLNLNFSYCTCLFHGVMSAVWPVTHTGPVCVHPWCCPGVSHLWRHSDPSIGTRRCHWETETEGQWNWEDRIWDTVPCMCAMFVHCCLHHPLSQRNWKYSERKRWLFTTRTYHSVIRPTLRCAVVTVKQLALSSSREIWLFMHIKTKHIIPRKHSDGPLLLHAHC